MSKPEIIYVEGVIVEIHNFGYAKYMYPYFNTNADFEVNKKGYKKLRSYLRMVRWLEKQLQNPEQASE